MDLKTHFTISISKDILLDFYNLADKKSINKSKLIENYLKNWVLQNSDVIDVSEFVCTQHYANYNLSVKGAN